jgi:glycogen debranching enzyme
VTEAWSYGGAPHLSAGNDGTLTLLEGITFCICGRNGDIRPGSEQGLFFRDTRFLTHFELEISGQRLEPLAVYLGAPFEATFVARRPPRQGTADSTLLVVRRRYVGNGMLEEITVRNLGAEPAAVALTLIVETDFASLFEVKEGRVRPRQGIEQRADGSAIELSYRIGADSRAVRLQGDGARANLPGQLSWQSVVSPRQSTTVSVEVTAIVDGVAAPLRYRPDQPPDDSQPAAQLAQWRRSIPVVSTPDQGFVSMLETCAEDIGALRIVDPDQPQRTVVAAGAPWFMTLFGRDSLLTSWMLLPADPSLALGTLQTLAGLQGTKVDPLSDEQPGRILHELRSGLDSVSGAGAVNVYYGSIDATPLFVMLLGELRRWGVGAAEVDGLLGNADRALAWIEHFGDRDGDGFVEYQRATDAGLINQGWKDSFDSISFARGTLAEPPIALAEVQGYVYAAYLARAHFAGEAGDLPGASHWAAKAAALKKRFNEAFWVADRGYFALALDGEKRPVDSLASNMGHCLWTGIVDEDKAESVANHLTSRELFSGYGIRTLATSMGAYNPMSYHNGSVWPHDTSIAAAGLMRYGFVKQAQRVVAGLLDAAKQQGGRLPELFCGFDRHDFPAPVPYPTSCSPQAWSSASPLLLLRTLLRLDPAVPSGRVWCAPAVTERYLPMRVEGLRIAGAAVNVGVYRTGWRIEGLPDSVEVSRTPRPALSDAFTHLSGQPGQASQ